jgi:hypothetical protein
MSCAGGASGGGNLNDGGGDHDDDVDDLWSLLYPNSPLARHTGVVLSRGLALTGLQPQEPVHPALLALQAALCGFEVARVQLASATTRGAAVAYRFEGRFVDDPDLEATLTIEFAGRSSPPPPPSSAIANPAACGQQHRKVVVVGPAPAPASPRVLSLNVRLSRGWLHDELCRSGFMDAAATEGKDAPLILSRIVSYLEHDKKRRAFLSRYPFVKVRFREATSADVKVPLLAKGSHGSSLYGALQETDVHWLNLSWGWCWMTGKESLRVAEPHPGSYAVPRGIEQLVALSGSCEDAISVILNLPALQERTAATKPAAFQLESLRDRESGDDTSNEADHSQLSQYELQRLERIKRNEQRLKELGLDEFKLPGSQQASPRKRRKR